MASEAELSHAAAQLGFPVIIKPTDGVGSKGVSRVDQPAALARAWERGMEVCRSGVLVCEEFVEGPEVSIEGLTIGPEPHLVAITDKITSGPPYFVETGHTQGSSLSPEHQEALRAAARCGILALGLENCATHSEIRMGPNGPRIMEIGARLGGDRITSDLVPLSTGVDLVAANLRLAMGDSPDLTPLRSEGAAIRYFLPEPGIVEAVDGREESRGAPGVVDWVLDVAPGGRVPPLRSSLTRVGHVVTRGGTPEEAARSAERSRSLLQIRTRRED